MQKEIKILIDYCSKDCTGDYLGRIDLIKRTVFEDGEMVYSDTISEKLHRISEDPLRKIEKGLFHESNRTENCLPQRENKICFFKTLWFKIFGK